MKGTDGALVPPALSSPDGDGANARAPPVDIDSVLLIVTPVAISAPRTPGPYQAERTMSDNGGPSPSLGAPPRRRPKSRSTTS